jgi:hypothetical protein
VFFSLEKPVLSKNITFSAKFFFTKKVIFLLKKAFPDEKIAFLCFYEKKSFFMIFMKKLIFYYNSLSQNFEEPIQIRIPRLRKPLVKLYQKWFSLKIRLP